MFNWGDNQSNYVVFNMRDVANFAHNFQNRGVKYRFPL